MAEHDQKTIQQAVPPEKRVAGGEGNISSTGPNVGEEGASTNAKDHDQGIAYEVKNLVIGANGKAVEIPQHMDGCPVKGMVLMSNPPQYPKLGYAGCTCVRDKIGRPTVMTPEVLQKLEVGYMHAYTDKEACLYAGIAVQTLYNYQREHPEFIERKKELQLTPNLTAKKVLVENIKDDVGQARWWAERKIRGEFQPSAKVEHTGNVVMTDQGANPEVDRAEEEIARKYEDELGQVMGKKKVEELPEVIEKNDEPVQP